ncbi:Threonine synthase [Venturia nashicola]|nr:Threonine synthase [Venturia nashicola]
MRLLTIVTPLTLLVLEVTGAAVALARGLTASDVVHTLTSNPNLLPESSRQVLEARLQEHGLSKRDDPRERPIKNDNLNAMMSAILSTIVNLDKIPPWSKVNKEENLESRLLLKKGLTNTMSLGAMKPCTGNCMITRMSTSIEWDDGRTAVVKEGAWLHHAVLLNIGPTDPVCGGPIEHLFESGNEKTEIGFGLPDGNIKSGYHVRKDDVFLLNTELMNMDDKEKWVWLQMSFDVVEGHDPAYKDGKVIWMSIGPDRCGGQVDNPFGRSNLTLSSRPIHNKFIEYSIPWKAKKGGYILGINSHMHDGGLKTDVYQNEKVLCSSIPEYTMSMSGGGMGGHSGHSGHSKRSTDSDERSERLRVRGDRIKRQEHKASLHIDHQTGCNFPTTELPIKKGDNLYLRVDYDFDKYPGMRDSNGEMEEIMGMAGTLVAFDYP